MISKTSYKVLGYNNGDFYNEWKDHEGEEYVEKVTKSFPVLLG
jgi:hypothetical protein